MPDAGMLRHPTRSCQDEWCERLWCSQVRVYGATRDVRSPIEAVIPAFPDESYRTRMALVHLDHEVHAAGTFASTVSRG